MAATQYRPSPQVTVVNTPVAPVAPMTTTVVSPMVAPAPVQHTTYVTQPPMMTPPPMMTVRSQACNTDAPDVIFYSPTLRHDPSSRGTSTYGPNGKI